MVKGHYSDMINWQSCLYKSQFLHALCHLPFSLLHPSLVSMFPWVMVQCNQHFITLSSVSTLLDDDILTLAMLFAVKASVNSSSCWLDLLHKMLLLLLVVFTYEWHSMQYCANISNDFLNGRVSVINQLSLNSSDVEVLETVSCEQSVYVFLFISHN